MRSISIIAVECMHILIFSKTFVGSLFAILIATWGAHIISDWGTEDFYKFLFDFGLLAINFLGVILATIWGVRVIHDGKHDGSIAICLSNSICRQQWLTGRLVGVMLSLTVVSVLVLLIWQLAMLLNNFGWLYNDQIVVISAHFLGWFVTASLSVLFAVFCSQTTTLLFTAFFWSLGQVTPLLVDKHKFLWVDLISWWDLSRFNPTIDIYHHSYPSIVDLLLSSWGYCLGMYAICALIFVRCDL